MKSNANELLIKHLKELGLTYEQEHRFHPERRWRFDFILPEHRIAIEIEGGIWVNGRHSRGYGFQKDLFKYNQAVMLGWRVLRFSTQDVLKGHTKAFLQEWFKREAEL